MPYKSLKYYLSTIVLKIKGHAYSIYCSTHKTYFEQLWSSYFKENTITINQSFDWQYSSLSYFNKPEEFRENYHFDSEMIPMCRKDFTPVFYNPLSIASYGLINLNQFSQDKNEKNLMVAVKMYRYLIGHAIVKNQALWFPYNINNKKFLLKTPWYAGITQALVLSLMIRLNKINTSTELKEHISLVYNSLLIPVGEGGFVATTPEGYKWIEEYPGSKSYVLNGNLFSLIAIYEYSLTFIEIDTSELIYQLTEGLIKTLHHYKRGKYWKYSRVNNTLSNIEYQGLYVHLFKHLWCLTDNEAFKILYLEANNNIDWKAFNSFYKIQ